MPNDALGLRVLSETSGQLRSAPRDVARIVRKEIRAAMSSEAEGVAEAVRGRAGQQGLVQATYAVKVTTRLNPNGASVAVKVDHNIARYARAYELGNKANFNEPDITNRLSSGKARNRREAIKQSRSALGAAAITGHALRVPVFHKVGEPGGWSVRATRPFFFPAVSASQAGTDLRMERMLVAIAKQNGFK